MIGRKEFRMSTAQNKQIVHRIMVSDRNKVWLRLTNTGTNTGGFMLLI